MSNPTNPEPLPPSPRHRRGQIVFFVFTITFIASRALVLLIMLRKIPDLFFHLGSTHIHHLNYGIFLLAAVGALLLLRPLSEEQKRWVACAYGFGMALTFDEFGMWLHLGGGYWQRASYDAVIVLSALLGLFAWAPSWRRLKPEHHLAGLVTLVALGLFCWLSIHTLNNFDRKMGKRLRLLEESGPS